MDYISHKYRENEITYMLNEGRANTLYSLIADKLKTFYVSGKLHNEKVDLISPPNPNIDRLVEGRHMLESHRIQIPGQKIRRLGYIGVVYYRVNKRGKPFRNVDYPASDIFSFRKPISRESITLLFNTYPSNLEHKINNDDEKMAWRALERDTFFNFCNSTKL